MTNAGAVLAGKVAVVTGGAAGIGAAVVEKFLSEGASVAFLDHDVRRGHATEQRLHGSMFVPCDVTVAAEVQRAIEEVEARFARIDVLVNNAGIAAAYDAVTMTELEWDELFAVDLKAVWLCTRSALPALRAAGQASIINISSIHSRLTRAGMFPYAAAKSAVIGLTRSLALDEGPRGVRVNVVCPGATRTEAVDAYLDTQADPAAALQALSAVSPLGRIGVPREIAAVVCFLASDEASFMTGAEVFVDGGLSARFAT